MEGSDAGARLEFIKKHKLEIKPLIDATEVSLQGELERISGMSSDSLNQQDTNIDDQELLERYETKLFVMEKHPEEYDEGAKNVIWAASNPAYYNPGLVDALRRDRRCKSLVLLADNVAGKAYEKLFSSEGNDGAIRQIMPSADLPESLFEQLGEELKKNSPDVAVTQFENENNPSTTLIFGAKSSLGAKKLYLLKAAWAGPSGRRDLLERQSAMDTFDGVLVADEVAKKVTEYELPGFPSDKIFVTGSAGIDALDIAHASALEQSGREKLELREDEIAVLYLGLPSADFKGRTPAIDPEVNEKTFTETILVLSDIARENPNKQFALIVRPHPRDGNKQFLQKEVSGIPSNFRVIQGSTVSMNEAAYASDITTSICSNENNFAPSRGKPSVFLGFREQGLGGQLLDSVFGKEVLDLFKNVPGVHIVDNESELKKYVASYERDTRMKPEDLTVPNTSSIERMLDVILAE